MYISAKNISFCDNPDLFLRCLTMFIMEEDFTGFNGTNKSVEDMKEKILKVSAKNSRAIRRC